MMMAITFTVCGDVYQLRLIGGLLCTEPAEQPFCKIVTGVQQAFESDGARSGAVIEKHCDGAALVKLDQVRSGRIDRGVRRLDPFRFRYASSVGRGNTKLLRVD